MTQEDNGRKASPDPAAPPSGVQNQDMTILLVGARSTTTDKVYPLNTENAQPAPTSMAYGNPTFHSDPYEFRRNPLHAYQPAPQQIQPRQEKCMNFYWYLYIFGWLFCLPPLWVGGAFGIRSKKENERIAGWVSLVTCIIITITVIIPVIILIVIIVDGLN